MFLLSRFTYRSRTMTPGAPFSTSTPLTWNRGVGSSVSLLLPAFQSPHRYRVTICSCTYPMLRLQNVYPGSEFFPSRILDPRSEFFPSRIHVKEFKYFNTKIVHPGSGCRIRILIFTLAGSRILRSKRHRIPDLDSHHFMFVVPVCCLLQNS
jgi:hypothetical protein